MPPSTAKLSVTIAVLSAILVGGCTNQARNQYGYNNHGYSYGGGVRGTIEQVERTQTQGDATGLGAAGGAVVGGLLGNQVGRGSGKKAATIAGVAAGAYAGHVAEKSYAGNQNAYRIVMRTNDGRVITNVQPDAMNLRIGDRARVDNDRIVPDY